MFSSRKSKKKYILIADDEPLNQDVFKKMLIDEYEISIVGDGKQCLESVASRLPDLLLLDVSMPELNGIEVCRKLRQQTLTQDLPIILVSAYDSENDRLNGMEAGATEYLSKPFDISRFHERVRELILDQR